MAVELLGLILGFSTSGVIFGMFLRSQSRRAIRDTYGL
jgi:hypothetical protein